MPFVRKLVQAPGWHQHIKRLGGALPVANVIQWDAVELQCEKPGSGKSGEVKTRPYPREVYDWYESATIHTGKRRIPKQVWVLLACLVLVPVLLYLGISGIGKRADKAKADAAVIEQLKVAPKPSGPKTAGDLLASYVPRVPGLQHTAPAYDELTKPKRVSVPAACVESHSGGCKCYTQDATSYPTTQDICRQIVKHGVFFDFAPEGQQVAQQQMQPQRPPPSDQPQDARTVQGTVPPVPVPRPGEVTVADVVAGRVPLR